MAGPSRQEEILSAVEALYAEGGAGAVTIRALSERSGASTGSIYHRFGERGGLLFEVLTRSFDDGLSQLVEVVREDPAAEPGVRQLVRAWLGWVEQHPLRARMIYELTASEALLAYREQLAAFKAPYFGAIEAWWRARTEAGALRPLPPWALDPVVMGPAHEFARRWLAGLDLPMEAAIPTISEAVWRSVRP